MRRPASFNTGRPRDVEMYRRTSAVEQDPSRRPPPTVLRPSSSEPLIIMVDESAHPAATRRRVARAPSANPTPPLGRRSSSSPPAERGPSPAARPRQPLALPPLSGRRSTGPSKTSTKTTSSSRRSDRAEIRQGRTLDQSVPVAVLRGGGGTYPGGMED